MQAQEPDGPQLDESVNLFLHKHHLEIVQAVIVEDTNPGNIVERQGDPPLNPM